VNQSSYTEITEEAQRPPSEDAASPNSSSRITATSVRSVTKSDLIAFEDRIRAHWEAGNLPCLLHLCGGNEAQLLEVFADIRPDDWVFSTHRNHYHALLKGIPAEKLEADILAGRSMFTFSREHNFYSSAILAGTCCIAAGVAHDIAEKHPIDLDDYWCEPAHSLPESRVPLSHQTRPFPWVWCFIGDGAMENGHFAEAIQWAAWNRLPLTFILEDNDRQVDTNKRTRRGYYSDDWRHQVVWPSAHFRSYSYVPTYPHAGSGCKTKIEFKPEAIERLKNQTQA
jgi:TPP-dependent pyruvate/acetoin dehydrogenase alpha subunit